MTGDPHARSFDQREYDFQARGEFIATRSLEDDFEVQVRLMAPSPTSRVSFIRAAALRLAGHNIMVDPVLAHPLVIDGELMEMDEGQMLLNADSTAVILRQRKRYTFIWPDGTNVHVGTHGRSLNVFIIPSEEREGRLEGLLGNADRDFGMNDFRTREGRQLPSPPPMSQRYDPWGDSWRIRQEASLFVYEPGENTETWTDRSGPTEPATLDALSPQARASAEARCRAAGITDPEPLRECTIDLGFSGDDMFIASALSQQLPPELAPVSETTDMEHRTFVAGDRTLFALDYASTPAGAFPDALELVRGEWEVFSLEGRRVLRNTGPRNSAFRIPLPETLPDAFTIEMGVQFTGNQSLLILTQPPDGYLFQVEHHYVELTHGGRGVTGVYAHPNTDLPTSVTRTDAMDDRLARVQILVEGTDAYVFVDGQGVAYLPNARLPRTGVLHVEAREAGSEDRPLYVGPIRVAALRSD